MKDKTPLIWAHRGVSGYCPENTLVAFEKAVEMKTDGVELDVQLSKDGELVVCHDEKIDRTSDGKGWIKDMSLDELRCFDFSCGKSDYKGIKIPTMAEVFRLLKPTNLVINIELKTGIIFYPEIEEKIIALTEEYGFMDRVIFSSFNHYSVMKIKALKNDARCGFLYADGTMNMPLYGKNNGVEALHPALYNLQYPNFMEECEKNGLDVNVWTVNEKDHIEMCYKAGVNAIITNYPDRVIDVIETFAGKSNE